MNPNDKEAQYKCRGCFDRGYLETHDMKDFIPQIGKCLIPCTCAAAQSTPPATSESAALNKWLDEAYHKIICTHPDSHILQTTTDKPWEALCERCGKRVILRPAKEDK